MRDPELDLPSRPPTRLRARILILVSGLSVLIFLIVAAGGWLVVLEAEDAILEGNLEQALLYVGDAELAAPPAWYEEFATADAVHDRLGIIELPGEVGVHEVFADSDGGNAIWVHDWGSRFAMWMSEDREREYRLWVNELGAKPRFQLADLSFFEFTESRVAAIQRSIFLAAAIMGILSLLLSYLIARWTLLPVLMLAAQVTHRGEAGKSSKLAGSYSADEIGFLAQALDDAETRANAALERERRFISDCSHELRTPVATLKSALTLVDELEDDPSHRAKVEARMRRAVDRMERLVQLFLVLSREGRQATAEGEVAVRSIIAEVVAEQAALHRPRVINVEIEMDESQTIAGRRDVLMVLIQNFVANVWRHADGNRLRFRWLAGNTLQIDDDGTGFPATTASSTMRADSTGFGVGLGLAERLCATQGWRMSRGQSDLGGARIEVHFAAASAV